MNGHKSKNKSEQHITSGGVTPSERYLGKLAHRSFLSLWSYSNLFTDEGRKNEKGTGKELCDLVVLFDNNVLLFSDKHCAFPDGNNLLTAWARWYRRTIEKSVNQLYGAESWIRRYPEKIYLDSHCTQPFPLPIPDVSKIRFFRISVARGAYSACKSFFGQGSSGSLLIDNEIQGKEHQNKPFHIGLVNPARGYVHVFDEMALDVVIREMDTISDFVEYLQKREKLLLRPGRSILATGEEQLLGMYLREIGEDGRHDFLEKDEAYDSIYFDEGTWEDLTKHPQYIAKKKADRISYAWDNLIEHFIKNGLPSSTTYLENALRVMAAEPRFRRRHLATMLLEAHGTEISPGGRLIRLGIDKNYPETVYVFLIVPKPAQIMNYEDYQERRKIFLIACCKVAILYSPEARYVVGIGAEPSGLGGSSESLVLIERYGGSWTQEVLDEAKELQEVTGILKKERIHYKRMTEPEYPGLDEEVSSPNNRKPFQRTIQGPNRAQRRANTKRRERRRKR